MFGGQENPLRPSPGAGLLIIHPIINVPHGSFLFQESLVRLAIGWGSVFGLRDRPPLRFCEWRPPVVAFSHSFRWTNGRSFTVGLVRLTR